MATVTQVIVTCDVCGTAKDVQGWTFGLDGKTYEIDLCPKDGKGLIKVAAGYVPKARKVTARRGSRHNGHRQRARADSAAIGDRDKAPGMKMPGRRRVTGSRQDAKISRPRHRASKVSGATAQAAGSKQDAKVGRPGLQAAGAASEQAAKATGVPQEKGIYVYGILPADIEVAADMPGVGQHPGLLRVVRCDGLAALISEVDLPGRLGSPEDLRAHREILDATATEVPVLPLRFGTVLASQNAVAQDLLTAHHDEFADALEHLDGRAEFLVKSRYIEGAVLGEILSENKQAAWLQDQIQGNEPDAARDARTELGQIINEALAAKREQDTRALEQAMEGICAASARREPAHKLDAVHVAFLMAVDQENEMDRVIEDMARDWEGRIEVQLLGPMAAYDFVTTAKPEG